MLDLVLEALHAQTQRAADMFIERLVERAVREDPNVQRAQAEYVARANIAYSAGNLPHEARERVERLYKAAHPIFGSIRFNGPPTTEQSMRLGVEYGKLSRSGAANAREWVAQLARVDQRRTGAPLKTGISTRALGLDGEWGRYDLAVLSCDSLLRALRSRGGHNQLAEAVVLQVLGHELPEPLDAMVRVFNLRSEDEP